MQQNIAPVASLPQPTLPTNQLQYIPMEVSETEPPIVATVPLPERTPTPTMERHVISRHVQAKPRTKTLGKLKSNFS